jgi:hypothetical protein
MAKVNLLFYGDSAPRNEPVTRETRINRCGQNGPEERRLIHICGRNREAAAKPQ